MTPLQQRALDLSLAYLDDAARRYGCELAPPAIGFDLRGTAAGQVRIDRQHWQIRYNALLLEQNAERFLQRTVPHEVAHLVTYQLYGRRVRPHGREWRGVMRDFGADPTRCHSFDTRLSRVRHLRTFHYRCACQRHELTSIRHNRIQRGMVYLCRNCQRPLVAAD